MKSHGLFRPPINPKNRIRYSRVDLRKMYAPHLEIGWRHGIPKWPDVHVGSGTCCIPRTQSGLLIAGLATFTLLAVSGGIGGDIPAIVDDHATESHVFKDLRRDCNADLHRSVFTPTDDGADASANQDLSKTVVALVDSISQRTGSWIRNDAKNVVCQQIPRSKRTARK